MRPGPRSSGSLLLLPLLFLGCSGHGRRQAGPEAEVGAATGGKAATLAAGRDLTRRFYSGDLKPVWDRMSVAQRNELGSLENLASFRTTVQDLVGDEVHLLAEETLRAEGQDTYLRRVRYEKSAEPFALKWTIDDQGNVTDFSIRPSQAATEFKYQTKTKLRLPFDGDWYVGSGGRTPEQNGNHHYDYRSRFDSDLLRVEDTRFDKNSNPPRNEDFAAFGQPILAPGPGVVAELRDGIPDNIPGQINLKPEERAGNFVAIDHGNGESSLLAHLKRGSVQVRFGQKVTAGQKVGECGNSGNSSAPHLHYGLRGAARPDKGMSLPAEFSGYFADGQKVDRGELHQGQRIRHAGG
jgi:hypothetical protein